MFGDVNISAILDSLSVSYDKRVRPNYGGLYNSLFNVFIHYFIFTLLSFADCDRALFCKNAVFEHLTCSHS